MNNFLNGSQCTVRYLNWQPATASEPGHYGAPTHRQGTFVGFGTDYLGLNNNTVGQYTTAIVMFTDGTLDAVPLGNVTII